MKHRKLDTTPEISQRMAKVKLKRNQPEINLAKGLWQKGIRYRLNYKELPGSPDIAITKSRIAIFVDGEFWHGKNFEEFKKGTHNNKDYWIEKIQENMDRDMRVDQQLRMLGWRPIHFWSSDILKHCDACNRYGV